MKFDNPNKILNSEAESGLIPAAGDDWLSRVNMTISNFKELLILAQKVGGFQSNFGQVKDAGSQEYIPAQSPFTQVVKQILASPYADIPIETILEQIKPYTLRQLMEIAKNAGLKR